MTITIDELKKLCDLILTVPVQQGITDVFIDVDDYRSIFSDDAFDLNDTNKGICIASFLDGWNSLMKIVDDQFFMTSVDCERLGSSISIIGDAILKSNKTGIKKISINDLKKICKKLMSIIDDSGFKEFTINKDCYRYIEAAEAYNMDIKEPHPQIRSLIDEWKNLKQILLNQRAATITDFEHLGNVIRMIGYIISITPDKELLDLRVEEVKDKSVKIKDLKKISQLILLALKKEDIKTIFVDVDYYWKIFTDDDAFDLNNLSQTACIGSFIDDWDSLMMVVDNKNHVTSLDCERLGNVTNIIGDAILASNKTGFKKIAINDFIKIFTKIFAAIEESGFVELMINEDRYGYISRDEAYNIYEEKQHPKIRSFVDEWKSLKNILAGQRAAAITDFEHLGNVIKIVGYAISRTTDRVLLDLREEL